MAEQDRHGSQWNSNPNNPVKDASGSSIIGGLLRGSGAEQDHHDSHFGSGAESVRNAASKLDSSILGGSGAEQDRHASHFGLGSENPIEDAAVRFKENLTGSGAEQDRHASHFGLKENNPARAAASRWNENSGSGAEQDRYGSHFELGDNNPIKNAASKAKASNFGKGTSASEQDRYGSHFGLGPNNPINPNEIGILRSTLLPSIGFHSGLAVVVYTASRATNRVDGKDWLWPTGQVVNAWWCAIGSRVLNDNISIRTAYSYLPYTEKLLLTGITAWGARLFYKIAWRSLTRGGDDPRYEEAKKEEGFWNKAFFSVFLPEALFQAVISLPLTLPFRAGDASALSSPLHVHPEWTHGLAVALFSSGFAMEVLADIQVAAQKKANPNNLNREGVWSIVRNPNHLGDALIHASFPLLLWSAGILHPLALLGPVANYVFLRYVGGDADDETVQELYINDKEKKQSQLLEYKSSKNSFWPRPEEASNPWTWAVIGAGVAGWAAERGVRSYLHR